MRYAHLLIAVMALACTGARADVGADLKALFADCHTVRTENKTQSKVWVTIYDLGKTRHLDYGWVEACSARDWKAGSYACGSYYYVRGEVKNFDLSQTVYDTTVQINPQASNPSSDIVAIRRGTGNYYWGHGDDTGGCDNQPAPGAPQVNVSVTNSTSGWAFVSAGGANVPSGATGCLAAGAKSTWKLATDVGYTISATPGLPANCTMPPGSPPATVTYTAQPDAGQVVVTLKSRYQLSDLHGASP